MPRKKKTDAALVTKALDPATGEALTVPAHKGKPFVRPMRIRLINPPDDFEPKGGWVGPSLKDVKAKQGEIITLEKPDALALVDSGRAARVMKSNSVPRRSVKEHFADLGLEVPGQ